MTVRITSTLFVLAALVALASAQSPFATAAATRESIHMTGLYGEPGESGSMWSLGTSTGYTLHTLFGDYADVSYSFAAMDYDILSRENAPDTYFSAAVTSPGTIRFSNPTHPNLLTIDFQLGELDLKNFTASDEQGDEVTFSGLIGDKINALAHDNDHDAFDFAFSNQTPAGPLPDSVSYATSFSVSAAPVPEPAPLFLLGLGAVAALRRRRP